LGYILCDFFSQTRLVTLVLAQVAISFNFREKKIFERESFRHFFVRKQSKVFRELARTREKWRLQMKRLVKVGNRKNKKKHP
jgi:hypothetical protein